MPTVPCISAIWRASTYLPDIYTRYLRLRGRDVISVCGSDEHGVPITIKARKEGVTPQQVVDRYHPDHQERSFEGLGMSFDIYSRTSSPTPCRHGVGLSSASSTTRASSSRSLRSSIMTRRRGTFLADRYIVGTCPKCGNDRAYGDQCEKCGSTLSPEELVDPHSAVSGSVPVLRETKHWYLPLDRYEDIPPRVDPRRAQGVEIQRLRAVQELARRRSAAACREPRPRLGHPRAGGGRRGQGALRLVRRSDRLHISRRRT